jgi:eukaryotic-like serine/threonine-protein kinase
VTETPRPPGDERFVDDQHRYRLDSRIATGGMGEVWRATDTSLGRPVAVKVLKSEYADDPVFRSRFEIEARHAASLHHPGVASLYDVGESALLGAADGSAVPRPFLVMELVDGQPLSALLRGGRPLDPVVVRDLMAQAAEAIGAAHAAGIVHRDVKPANLLVTPDRQVKITDFGIARASDGLGLTGTGQVMGTPQYLSPEQARGAVATPASDVYSLGVVAFECLAGHRPFDADSPVATALAHLNDPVPDLPPGIPADLAAVVRRAMAKEPSERYVDGAAFAAALRDPTAAAETAFVPMPAGDVLPAERTQVLSVPPQPAPVPVTAPVAAPTTVTGPPEPIDEDPRRSWLVVLLVLALVAAIVLVIAVIVKASGGGDEPISQGGVTRSAPTTSAPTTEDTPTKESSSAPATVLIDESDYLGRDVDEVAAELRDKGLEVKTQPVDNPDGKDADTVAAVHPDGRLQEGDTVTVDYYREPEPTSEPPSSHPTSASPSGPASGSASASGTASPASQGATPSGSASAGVATGAPSGGSSSASSGAATGAATTGAGAAAR